MTSTSDETQKDDDSDDKRNKRRNRTFLGGKVVINEKGSVIDCVVKNKSDIGCQIIVEHQDAIPDEFELKISNGEYYQCSVIWRRREKLGLEFKKN